MPALGMHKVGGQAEQPSPFGHLAAGGQTRMTEYEMQLQQQIELMRKQIEL